jgi:hypothetical protein
MIYHQNLKEKQGLKTVMDLAMKSESIIGKSRDSLVFKWGWIYGQFIWIKARHIKYN